ncbi:MAG: thioredoxin domain-containing protein [Alphaproteobacteria bacterium]|nr:thioredoxin domain-containing protein [Alphaproteobacteria bacterium]
MIRRHIVVVVALVAAAVFTTAVHLFERRTVEVAATRAAEQAGAMVRPHSPIIGPADAPVTIVEFFDPACEACKAFHPQVKQILSSWPGQIRLVIRYAPFHRDASVEAVRVLEAARAQGKFESTLEVLLANQRTWSGQGVNSTARVWQLALSAGLDIEVGFPQFPGRFA